MRVRRVRLGGSAGSHVSPLQPKPLSLAVTPMQQGLDTLQRSFLLWWLSLLQEMGASGSSL